ncbi:MAG: glutathione S-transferase N-terminal domain-containing protein [Gammaproteobacteria bacterium]|nr:glutathione S-transferase N-terminal domain-containing protein [Gammaproteobacteria bacterium]
MALIANRKSVMTLFTGLTDVYSHRVRIVLAEKGITADLYEVEPGKLPDDLVELNPYATIPTLVDRDLVLYDAQVIMEYLDERFPHPPLMPVDPVSRARSRLNVRRIERDWCPLADKIVKVNTATADQARKQLREALIQATPLFAQKPFFLSDEFSIVDCAIIPILWRLPVYGIELPASAKAVTDYAKRVFVRDTVRSSLLESEKEMR